MSLTSYRAAPPRGKLVGIVKKGFDLWFPGSPDGLGLGGIQLADLAATYSPAP
jgi:hypothetical protein